MPGILKRSHDQVEGDSQEVVPGGPEKKRQAMGSQNQVNGGMRAQNGTPNSGSLEDAGLSKALEDAAAASPPELFHVTGNYVSLSTLVERVAQETFIDLEQLITELADLQSQQVNGFGSGQSASIAVQKKERLFNFCHGYRAKFIKLLVLSQWSRQAEAVSKVIDINSWIVQQKELYRNSTAWMGELKRMLSTSKLPAADLKTALEILSTGKADWYSDLGYVKPKPYTPKQLLKALRTINTLLTIRLNTDEEIPPEMMDFSIASGRATFRVTDEFELDLSIADEDPNSQLFFIDFRFAFAPCMTDVPEGPLRDHVEGRTNDVLRREGLAGCYRFLHELVMTHKLGILRQQAFELARGRWTENVRVELVHRTLIIQYWTNRPGPKSWIEIGTRKRRRKADAHFGETSHLSLRWHRHGKEVVDHDIKINVANLSMEGLLKEVIARHTNYIFRHVKASLKQGSVYSKGLTIKHRAHPREPAECSLKMQITTSDLATIAQEPVSGFFAISPSSELHYRTERDLNRLRDPAKEASARLVVLRCNEALAKVQARARMRRWQKVQTMTLNQETIRKHFGTGVLRYTFYRIPQWHKDWALALTSGPAGDQWWAIEVRDPPRKLGPLELSGEPFLPVCRAIKVTLDTSSANVFEATNASLSLVESAAAAVISEFVNVRELTRKKLHYEQRKPLKPMAHLLAADCFIHYKPEGTPWCHEVVKSSYLGLSRTSAFTNSVVTLRLRKPIRNIKNIVSSMDSAIAFQPSNGDLSFRLRTPLGTASVTELLRRLSRIAYLVHYIEITNRYSLTISNIALSSLTIQYAPNHGTVPPSSLGAEIHFPEGANKSIKLANGNPHIRILDSLNQALNINDMTGFQHVLLILRKTLSLMRGLDAIERLPHPGVELRVLTRSATCIGIRYSSGNVCINYEIRMRLKPEEQHVWFADMSSERSIRVGSTVSGISATQLAANKAAAPTATAGGKGQPASGKPGTAAAAAAASAKAAAAEEAARLQLERRQTQAVQKAWFELTREKGELWYGLGGGVLAQLDGGESCLLRMHEVLCKVVVQVAAMSSSSGDDKGKVEIKAEFKGSEKGAAGAAPGPTKGAAPTGNAGKQQGQGQLAGGARGKQGARQQEVITLD